MSIDYLKNDSIMALFVNAKKYQKVELTGLRLPKDNEMGQEFITYVKDSDTHSQGFRQESVNTVTNQIVVARNATLLGYDSQGKAIYNEWLVAHFTIIKNYGKDVFDNLSYEFTFHKKKATVRAILLTQDVLDFAGVEGNILPIQVSWSPDPMMAKIGDYLTNDGYSISAHDMSSYELIE